MDSLADHIAGRSGVPDLVGLLAETLTASELNTLLLEVMRRRAASVSPAHLLRQYEQNRFVPPAAGDPLLRMAFDLRLLGAAQTAGFTPVELSPVCPLGTCSTTATVHQDKVLSALRGTEVVADATNVLALESSVQRRKALLSNPRAATRIRYCAVHRHLRTPPVPDIPGFSQHFKIFCLTTAGRDEGNFRFERGTLVEHIGFYIAVLRRECALPLHHIRVELKALNDGDKSNALCDAACAELYTRFPELPIVTHVAQQEHEQYYRGLNWKIVPMLQGNEYAVIDGGVVDWTQRLLGNSKERLMISGLGTDFLLRLMNNVQELNT